MNTNPQWPRHKDGRRKMPSQMTPRELWIATGMVARRKSKS